MSNLPQKAFNAVFTPMGRRNLRHRSKMWRARRNPDYQQNGAMVYGLNNGNRFVLHRDNHLAEIIFLDGAYEPLETLIVSAVVRAQDVVLDIGANIGYYTAFLDRLVGPGGQVHSFEPGDGTFAKLELTKKLLHLDRTVLHQEAISDQAGHIDFFLSTSGSDAQQSTVKAAALGEQIHKRTVKATTMDAFVAELKAKGAPGLAFVKCDIEGAELFMIRGAKQLLASANPPVWLIEHNRPALVEHGNSSADLVSPFVNFEIYYVPLSWPPSIMTVKQAKKWNGVASDLPDECNLIIVPKSGAQADRSQALRQAGLIA